MVHNNEIAIKLLRHEYADYDDNSWHYDREYKMLVEAQNLVLAKESNVETSEDKCTLHDVNGWAFAVDDKVRKGNKFGVVTRISDKAVHVQYSNGLFEKFHFNPRHHMQTHINLLEHCR